MGVTGEKKSMLIILLKFAENLVKAIEHNQN
jgi:hypothetical protein